MSYYKRMLAAGLMSAAILSSCSLPKDAYTNNNENKVNQSQTDDSSRESSLKRLKTQTIKNNQKEFKIKRNIGKKIPIKIEVKNEKGSNITSNGKLGTKDKVFSWTVSDMNKKDLHELLGNNISYQIMYSNGQTYRFIQKLNYEGGSNNEY